MLYKIAYGSCRIIENTNIIKKYILTNGFYVYVDVYNGKPYYGVFINRGDKVGRWI